MKKLALALFAPFLMGSLLAMEEEHCPLIGKVNMNLLKERSQAVGKGVKLDIRITPPEKGDAIEEETSLESSLLPTELTLSLLYQYFPDLQEIFAKWSTDYDGARINIRAWIDDPAYTAYNFGVTGFDYIEFEHKE